MKTVCALRGQRGFNMLELMVVMAVATIVLSVGVPSFSQMSMSNSMVSQTNALVNTLNTARAEALKTNLQVTVCKSDDNAACTNGLNWQDGWIAFIDVNADGVRGGADEILLWSHPGLDGAATLTSAAFDNFIAFAPNGTSIGSTANAGIFRFCDGRGIAGATDVTVTRTGGLSATGAAGGAC